MAELHVHLHVSLSPRTLRWALPALLLGLCAGEIASESFTMTSYYPAPSGIYTQMITTGRTYLARDAGGRVGIGTTAPEGALSVAGDVGIGAVASTDQAAHMLDVASAKGGANNSAIRALYPTGGGLAATEFAALAHRGGQWNAVYAKGGTGGAAALYTDGEVNMMAGSVGVGTLGPVNKLDVSGNLAVGSYAGANAGPANGLIVSGSVGVGTTSPSTKLDVSGGARVTLDMSVGGNLSVAGQTRLGAAASDPAGVNGALYYNSGTNRYRGYRNGAWADLAGSIGWEIIRVANGANFSSAMAFCSAGKKIIGGGCGNYGSDQTTTKKLVWSMPLSSDNGWVCYYDLALPANSISAMAICANVGP